jgi:hypothetical protein
MLCMVTVTEALLEDRSPLSVSPYDSRQNFDK